MNTGLVLDPCFTLHKTTPGHPECAERIVAIEQALEKADLIKRCRSIQPVAASEKMILLNHSSTYLARLKKACETDEPFIDCVDSSISRESYRIATLAAGSVLEAINLVIRGDIQNAFCAVRPPGHHAEREISMGFCLFNNIAIAARYLIREIALQRVLILDWDVHHGNGTQHSFEDDPQVFFCSFHGHPATLYPGTGYENERGIGKGVGTTLNIPMSPGSGDREYREAFEEKFLPAARAFNPEFILISAGFDAHRDDPVGNMVLDSASFQWLTQEMLKLAKECCGGKLVSILEGGYNLRALGECAAVHVKELISS